MSKRLGNGDGLSCWTLILLVQWNLVYLHVNAVKTKCNLLDVLDDQSEFQIGVVLREHIFCLVGQHDLFECHRLFDCQLDVNSVVRTYGSDFIELGGEQEEEELLVR